MKTNYYDRYDKYPLRLNVLDTLSLILQKMRSKEPFSLLRLGDGEGRLLGYPEFVSKSGDGTNSLSRSLGIWFGHDNLSDSALASLSIQLREAVSNADIVGLPRKKQYSSFEPYQFVFKAMSDFDLERPNQKFVDAAIHRYLQFGLFYSEILSNLDFAGFIGGRNIAVKAKTIFNIEESVQYLVPAEAIHPGTLTQQHYPDMFNRIRKELRVPYQGALFLVGAGCLGKIYCNWIKEKGGIALDIGSIFDSWANQGRLQHDYHNIRHYQLNRNSTLEFRIQRYNLACDHFSIDTERL